MSCRISLPIWPSSLDCVDWSQDNYIAVGGGDQIAILTPRFHDPDANGSYWTSTVLKANAFTVEEVPLLIPLSFNNFSAGEEISLRHVQTLKWSPPGIAKFARCMLAVLSANHALSLWQCDGRPEVDSNWKRVIIVNHALRRYYESRAEINTNSALKQSERKQIQQRVTAFSWSSLQPSANDDPTGYAVRNHQLLGVSTEAGDILLLRIQSPHDILHSGKYDPRIEVAFALNVKEPTTKAVPATSRPAHRTLKDPAKEAFVADHLAISVLASQTGGMGHRASIAYITSGQLFCVKLEVQSTAESSGMQWEQVSCERLNPLRSDMTGPLKFIPGSRCLTAFAADAAYCINVLADWNAGNSATEHHLDGRWDEVSGTAVSKSGTRSLHMHITSHLSSAVAKTTVLSIPSMTDVTNAAPAWQTAIKKTKAEFSASYNLDGHVIERVWGIASSPLGNYFATATTTLPSNAVAYVIASDQHTVVNIRHETTSGEQVSLFGSVAHPLSVTAETSLFYLQRQSDEQRGLTDMDALIQQAKVAAKDLTPMKYGLEDDGGASVVSMDTDQIISHLRRQMFLNPGLMSDRVKLLGDMAARKVSNVNQISKQVVHRLIAEVLTMTWRFDQASSSMSSKIIRVYQTISAKLEAGQETRLDGTTGGDWTEECRICHKHIQFESIKWARCEAGHQFSRCALTFFALQEPSISKHCKICRLQYLNEWQLPELQPQSEHEEQPTTGISDNPDGRYVGASSTATEPPSSLARVLFAALDRCIYCGGKFVA